MSICEHNTVAGRLIDLMMVILERQRATQTRRKKVANQIDFKVYTKTSTLEF